jgi:hypothetical protein
MGDFTVWSHTWRKNGRFYCVKSYLTGKKWAILLCEVIPDWKMGDFTVWSHTWRKKWAILLCEVIPDGKNWVNCAVFFKCNSAGLRNVLSRRLSKTELHSSLRESHSFFSLSADITMARSQGTSFSSNSFSRWASYDIFLFKYHSLPYILRFLFFFSDNIMADVASKQQTTALFLSTTVTRTWRHIELTKKLTNLMRNLCYAREHSVKFFMQFFLRS